MEDLLQECYFPPLELEDAGNGTFLENEFHVDGQSISYTLKNPNEVGRPPKLWRYQDFSSHGPFERKKAILDASLSKVTKNTNRDDVLLNSGRKKVNEFRQAGFPVRMIRQACGWMARRSGRLAWLRVRDELPCPAKKPHAA